MKKLLLSFIFSLPFLIWAQNQAPIITNFNVSTTNITGEYLVQYGLSDAENDPVEISIFVSIDSGRNYIHQPVSATGDIGFPITSGIFKTMNINVDTFGQYMFFKLIADDRHTIDIQTIVNKVDSNNLKNNLQFIQGARNHTTNSAHLYNVRDSLTNYFDAQGLKIENQVWTVNGYPAVNVIGTKRGTTGEASIYIVDAHYDGVVGSPAADDNGSGVAGLMEAARILSQYNFEKTIKFIGFDMEELGLVGSERFVNHGITDSDTIEGVLNLEMIGYYSERPNSQDLPAGFNLLFPSQTAAVAADSYRGNFITNVANTASDPLRLAFDSAAARYIPDLRVISLAVPGNGSIAPDLRRSDHANFWDANIPALMITNSSEFRNKNYHTAHDVLDSLNFTFMSNVTKATIATLAEVAGITNSSYATTRLLIGFGVNELKEPLARIFPNPAKNHITVELNEGVSADYKVEIATLKGEKIYSRHIKKGLDKFTVDVRNYPAGVYFITLSNKKDRQTFKVTIE